MDSFYRFHSFVPFFGLIFSLLIFENQAFTAITDMQQFLKVEEIVLKTLQPFIEQQERDLEILKKYLADFEHVYENVKDISNPLNAFVVLKKLTKDWKEVEQILSQNNGTAVRRKLMSPKSKLPFPKHDDLRGAVSGLLRIQKTYGLNVTDIANGDLKNFKMRTQMTPSDCFEMGLVSNENNDFENAVLWLTEANNRLQKHSIHSKDILRTYTLDTLALSHFRLGDFIAALDTTKELLSLMPDSDIVKQNMNFYEQMVKNNNGNNKVEKKKSSLQEHYEKLCRQEIKPTPREEAPLRCKHLKRTPFLRIAPFKIEEVSMDPYIVILYDVIFDEEIRFLQQFSKPYLERARIINQNGTIEFSTTRTGQSAWIFDDSPKQIQSIDRRVEEITGLTTLTAEPIQVVNYGIGGHYDTHFDFVGVDDKTSFPKIGNRLATILFYLTDVLQGGATVFPDLDLAVFPKKGSAILWYNLDTSGEPDRLTMHGACPVIQGDKWVCNKWLHERGQEFRRPCTFVMVNDTEHKNEIDE